ncbi:hypothetical protein [Actinocrinis sp.]|jgi:hypothetical protein|uniref:hypothetical protein n=1 Tax=Actinocrinis sp. TaxID=1920516 RepID=UPI002BDBC0A2|nr:hypothetical protein [Actinocrinis sp.]HXR73558.1 hypothetical protein [Actinocrinis sp.]
MNERRSRNLDTVLAAAAAPPLPEEEDARDLANVLTMFHTAGVAVEAGVAATEPITALSPIESEGATQPDVRSAGGAPRLSFMMKCAVAFVFVLGISIAISSTGMLPSPVQSFVHHVFGGIGVPAPSQNGGTPSGNGSAPANPAPTVSTGPNSIASASALASASSVNRAGAPSTSAPGAGVSTASPSATEASLYTLCTQVKGSGNSWKTTMSAQDQARLIAAAGSENKVHAYCNQLLKSSTSSSNTTTVAPSPSATD